MNITTISSLMSAVLLLNISCKSQSKNLADCKKNYRAAVSLVAQFYEKNDTDLLRKANALLDSSMLCPETRHASIAIKIPVLSLLNENQEGARFINSQRASDFQRPYDKLMYSSF